MGALILLTVVLVLVSVGAPLFRRGLRSREHTITLTIRLDATAALRAFAAASVTAREARRADRDRVAAMLEGAADAHAADAAHLDRLTGHTRGAAVEKLTAGGHRAVACVLRDLARDVAEEGA